MLPAKKKKITEFQFFFVYGFGLLVKVWFVFMVLALEVPGLFR
jgi:hypothetical protein